MGTSKPNYFPNLNGLRAIGALIVLIGHVEFLKQFWNIDTFDWFPIPGKVGVALFFSLSGFLITSLLMQEQSKNGRISLKKFYLRRIFRIWPLYYIVVFGSIFIFNRIDFLKIPLDSDAMIQNLSFKEIFIVAFLLPNFTNFSIPYANQRWSIVVEEQFYIIQPIFVKWIKSPGRLAIFFLFFIFSPEIIAFCLKVLRADAILQSSIFQAGLNQLKYLACIAVGCLFSVFFLLKRGGFVRKVIFSRTTQIVTLMIVVLLVVWGHYVFKSHVFIDLRVYSFLFSIVVVNAALNKNSNIIKLESFYLNFLGEISYGLYMYHPICIGLTLSIFSSFTRENPVTGNFLVYLFSLAFSIVVSYYSFHYVEKMFLKLKHKYGSTEKN